jgi:hypothetical protein
VKNEANREMRNMRADDDLSRDRPGEARKTNPNSHDGRVIRCGSGRDVSEWEDQIWRDRPMAAALPVFRRFAVGRRCGPDPRLARKSRKIAKRSQIEKHRNSLMIMDLNAMVGSPDAKNRSQLPCQLRQSTCSPDAGEVWDFRALRPTWNLRERRSRAVARCRRLAIRL